MHVLRSPQEAYRRVDFDARVAGADPVQLVLVCYEQLASALGTAIHAQARGDNAAKSASLTRALSALTALQMGLDQDQPIAGALSALFEGARKTVLDSVLQFDADALTALRRDISEIADAFRANATSPG
ncbi:MAG: flagellar export chaperone FliS [Novosphingobium sp.]